MAIADHSSIKRQFWLLAVCLPAAALANAGTPLMWTGCCWLFLGNWAIGHLEAWVFRRMTGAPIHAPLIVCANYVSATLGVGLVWLCNEYADLTLVGYWGFAGLWALAFLVTIASELWFFARAAKLEGLSLNIWKVTMIANVVSYACLLPITMFLGATSLWKVNVVSVHAMHMLKGRVIYLAPDGRTVMSIRLDGTEARALFKIHGERAEVFVIPSKDGKSSVLVDGKSNVLLKLGAANQAAAVFGEPQFGLYNGPMSARPFVVPQPRDTKVVNGFWGVLGLRVQIGSVYRRYALETPFAAAIWHDITLLPDNTIVGSVGRHVVMLDAKANRLAVLARGSSPGVLLDLAAAPKRKVHVVDSSSVYGEEPKP